MGSRWTTGRWIGPTNWASDVCSAIDAVERWIDGPADVVVDASALAGAPGPLPDDAVRVVRLVTDGRRDPAVAACSGAAIAEMRARALTDAPTGRTTNAIVLPAGFPDAAPADRAPLDRSVGTEDLAHALAFLLDPDNDYLTGQVISLLGGDDVWGL